MEIEIDKINWEKKQNQQTPRLQSELKEAELNRQLIGLLESGVIRKSKAKFWSQVHLAPKHR